MLVWDTGASYGLTPFCSDFIDYVSCDIPVKDVTKVNRVIRIGTTLSKFIDEDGQEIFLPCVSYHLTQTNVRLFSPQTYHQMHGGESIVSADWVVMELNYQRIVILIKIGGTNLPAVHTLFVTEKQKKTIGHQLCSLLAYSRLTKLDFFGDLDSIGSVQAMSVSSEQQTTEQEFEQHHSHFCGACMGAPAHQNSSRPQKELLLWHWKLGIGMQQIQVLMRPRTYEEPNGNILVLPPIVQPKFPTAKNCAIPACESCMLARANRKRSTNN
jgi:hypothetical protein